MNKISIILILLMIAFIPSAQAVEFSTIYNPFTSKLDYYRTTNMSGENITADYITAIEVTATNLYGILPWVNLSSYPNACPAGSYLTALNDTVTCTAAMRTTGENVSGEYNFSGTGNVSFDDNVLFVDYTNDRVGVNTPTPNATLHVRGNLTEDGVVRITGYGSGPTERSWDLISNDGTRLFSIKDFNGNSVRLTIDSAGNVDIPSSNLTVDTDTLFVDSTNDEVGINTATPTASLHVISAATDIAIFTGATDGTVAINSVSSDSKLAFQNNGIVEWSMGFDDNEDDRFAIVTGANLGTAYKLVIEEGGDIGMGTANPEVGLHIYDATGDAELQIESNGTGANGDAGINLFANTSANSRIRFGDTDDNNVGLINYDHTEDDMTFRVGDSTRMTINGTSGDTIIDKLGVNIDPVYTLHVNSGTGDNPARIESSDELAAVAITDSGDTFWLGVNGTDNVGWIGSSGSTPSGMIMNLSTGESYFPNNVGFGTVTNPDTNVHIDASGGGNMRLSRTTGGGSTQTLGIIQYGTEDGDGNLVQLGAYQDGATDAGAFTISTEATGEALTEKFRVESDGDVNVTDGNLWVNDGNAWLGVGSSPTLNHRAQNRLISSTQFAVIIDSDDTSANQYFAVAKDSTTIGAMEALFRVEEDGDVGIATVAPAYPLEINATDGSGISLYTLGNISADDYITRSTAFDGDALIALKGMRSDGNGKPDYSTYPDELKVEMTAPIREIIERTFDEVIYVNETKNVTYIDEIQIPVIVEENVEVGKQIIVPVIVQNNLYDENGTVIGYENVTENQTQTVYVYEKQNVTKYVSQEVEKTEERIVEVPKTIQVQKNITEITGYEEVNGTSQGELNAYQTRAIQQLLEEITLLKTRIATLELSEASK